MFRIRSNITDFKPSPWKIVKSQQLGTGPFHGPGRDFLGPQLREWSKTKSVHFFVVVKVNQNKWSSKISIFGVIIKSFKALRRLQNLRKQKHENQKKVPSHTVTETHKKAFRYVLRNQTNCWGTMKRCFFNKQIKWIPSQTYHFSPSSQGPTSSKRSEGGRKESLKPTKKRAKNQIKQWILKTFVWTKVDQI